MPLAAVVGVLVAVALVASLALALGSRRAGARSPIASALLMAAVVVTVVVAVLVALSAWQDSGAFMFAFVGIPVACAMLVLVVDPSRSTDDAGDVDGCRGHAGLEPRDVSGRGILLPRPVGADDRGGCWLHP